MEYTRTATNHLKLADEGIEYLKGATRDTPQLGSQVYDVYWKSVQVRLVYAVVHALLAIAQAITQEARQ